MRRERSLLFSNGIPLIVCIISIACFIGSRYNDHFIWAFSLGSALICSGFVMVLQQWFIGIQALFNSRTVGTISEATIVLG